jgi:hypothetical protein
MRPEIINFFSFKVSRRSPKHLWCQHLYKKNKKKIFVYCPLLFVYSFFSFIYPSYNRLCVWEGVLFLAANSHR